MLTDLTNNLDKVSPQLWQSTTTTDDDLERKAMERVIEEARKAIEYRPDGRADTGDLEEALTVLDGIRALRKESDQ